MNKSTKDFKFKWLHIFIKLAIQKRELAVSFIVEFFR